jgi:hypothetical protein
VKTIFALFIEFPFGKISEKAPDIGTLGHRDIGALIHWDIGTLGHRDSGALRHWDIGTLDIGTLGDWDIGTLEHLDHWAMSMNGWTLFKSHQGDI